MITVVTSSLEETQSLAEVIGKVVRGKEVIELVSDLGGGKTTFVKGLARGMQITEVVQSPTFTISRLYHARDGLELHHFDFYRLEQAGVMAAELAESLAQATAVVVIEWGAVVDNVLPKDRLSITITSLDDTKRRLDLTIPARYEYILQAVNHYKELRGQHSA